MAIKLELGRLRFAAGRVKAQQQPPQPGPTVAVPDSWLRQQLAALAPTEYSSDVALEFPAVPAAIRLVSRELARMEVIVEERQAGEWREVPPVPPTPDGIRDETHVLYGQWADYKSQSKSMLLLARGLMLHGYAPIFMVRDPQLRQLLVLDPADVRRQEWQGAVQYTYGGTLPGIPRVIDRRDLIWIDYDPPLDGINTVAPIKGIWPSFRQAVAAARFSARYFDSGATGNVIYSPEDPLGQDANKAFSQDMWELEDEMRESGRRSLSTPARIRVTKLSGDPQHAQVIQLLTYGVQDVCRVFGVPPMALQELSRGTYSNYGQSLRFLARFTLTNLAHSIADEISAMLWPSGFRRVRFEVADLGDESLLERSQRHKIEIESGVITQNEARKESKREEKANDPQADALARTPTFPVPETLGFDVDGEDLDGAPAAGGGADDDEEEFE